MKRLIIYTDGGARGNPGPAGAAAVFYDEKGKKIKEITQFLGIATNNQAEYRAVILALKEAQKLPFPLVEVYLDSELVVNQLKGKYKIKNFNLKPLYLELKSLIYQFKDVRFNYTSRDNNKLADKLVNEVIKNNT